MKRVVGCPELAEGPADEAADDALEAPDSSAGTAFARTSRTSARTRSRVDSLSAMVFYSRMCVPIECRLVKHNSSRVAKIQQSTCIGRHLVCTHRKIDSTEIDPAFPYLEDDSAPARRLFSQDRLLHKRVGVSTGDKVYAVDLCYHLRIADLIAFGIGIGGC